MVTCQKVVLTYQHFHVNDLMKALESFIVVIIYIHIFIYIYYVLYVNMLMLEVIGSH